jgi:hypothetical protein
MTYQVCVIIGLIFLGCIYAYMEEKRKRKLAVKGSLASATKRSTHKHRDSKMSSKKPHRISNILRSIWFF